MHSVAVPRHALAPRAAGQFSSATAQRQLAAPRRGALVVRADAAAGIDAEIEALNKHFGIPGRVDVVAGPGGLPTVRLQHACGSSAEVTLFGACITSWKQASGDEVLYVRPDAVFDKSKPISGGIPHCFPQFGPSDKMQQHGFARNLDWQIASTSADPQPDDRDPEVTLVLTENAYTKGMWPHSFRVAYSVALHGELLRADMRVLNTGTTSFDFTAALHTYIEVVDVEQARVRGLKGLTYLDKTVDPKNPVQKTEEREEVTFSGPTDSVYLKAKDYVELDVGTGAAVTITSNKWSDVVVWSPWDVMDCYRSFVCVENAQFSTPVTLKPGEFWRSQCEWAVKDL
ncbi:hypothetical protein COHA_000180 [Chlorella ohadii]|uniref:glucose-6-phosphate 1-epimerase n=1 Tax=Chlorella ohadii TaxID=2649997 RepID=A0AAD5E0V7_9CHLO|nr:hypothetical protein COHA_000180 [Chlorella ohadii]